MPMGKLSGIYYRAQEVIDQQARQSLRAKRRGHCYDIYVELEYVVALKLVRHMPTGRATYSMHLPCVLMTQPRFQDPKGRDKLHDFTLDLCLMFFAFFQGKEMIEFQLHIPSDPAMSGADVYPPDVPKFVELPWQPSLIHGCAIRFSVLFT